MRWTRSFLCCARAGISVLRTGCQWNALRETTLCSSSSAHRRFQEWAEAGVFAAFWRKGLLAYDALAGIDWTWLALGGAMGKAPLGGGETGRNPTDRSKLGVKRSALTDGRGVPLGAAIAGANRNDHKLMRETLDAIPVERPRPTRRHPQHLLDKGLDYDEPRAIAAEFAFTLHLRTRSEEINAKRRARAKARRWVVGRTHSWLNRFRAVLIRWNRKPGNYLALLHSAFGLITWRRTLPGWILRFPEPPSADPATRARRRACWRRGRRARSRPWRRAPRGR